jgi:2Fe-2S ferredoxin
MDAAERDGAARSLKEETRIMVKTSLDDQTTRYGAEPGGGAPTKAKITFVDSHGQARTVEGETGSTVMETARRNDIPEIAAECGGACACATCHVYVDAALIEKTGARSQMEEDMLDFAFDVQPNSRLCCQITVSPGLDGLIVRTPAQQG